MPQKSEKKSERLEIRLPFSKKADFLKACEQQSDTPSNVVRRFINSYIRRSNADEFKFTHKVLGRRLFRPVTASALMGLLVAGFWLISTPTPSQAQTLNKDNLPTDVLKDSRWMFRIILHCEIGVEENLPTLKALDMRRSWFGYYDRDIILVMIDDENVVVGGPVPNIDGHYSLVLRFVEEQRAVLSDKAQCSENSRRTVLIGKDGNIKESWDRLPKKSEVFSLIDEMLMN